MDRTSPSQAQLSGLVSKHVAQLYERGAPVADPLHALGHLHDQLVAAAKDYEAGPQQQRQAVCDAIIAISQFLKEQGFSSATLVTLNRMLQAIVDLCKNNHPDPLFCEKRSRTKPRRDLADALRQGQIAAIADAWLKSASDGEGGEDAMLDHAARKMSGLYFGTLDRATLSSARTYQRQAGHSDLLYDSFKQMREALKVEAEFVGGGREGPRLAILAQIKALNTKAKMQRS